MTDFCSHCYRATTTLAATVVSGAWIRQRAATLACALAKTSVLAAALASSAATAKPYLYDWNWMYLPSSVAVLPNGTLDIGYTAQRLTADQVAALRASSTDYLSVWLVTDFGADAWGVYAADPSAAVSKNLTSVTGWNAAVGGSAQPPLGASFHHISTGRTVSGASDMLTTTLCTGFAVEMSTTSARPLPGTHCITVAGRPGACAVSFVGGGIIDLGTLMPNETGRGTGLVTVSCPGPYSLKWTVTGLSDPGVELKGSAGSCTTTTAFPLLTVLSGPTNAGSLCIEAVGRWGEPGVKTVTGTLLIEPL